MSWWRTCQDARSFKMEYTEPRPKNISKFKTTPLPIVSSLENKIKGVFNDFCVLVENENHMRNLISMGSFGKANLSRNYPQFEENQPGIVRERVAKTRKMWGQKVSKTPEKIIVVPDSDSENEEYFENLTPRYELDRSGIKETVHLGLEEAFFLAAGVKCLDIFYESKKLDDLKAWSLFKNTDPYFVVNYIAYHYFRSKNWVVKSGIKFGGDFLLYKEGPSFYHASYVVVIRVVDENLDKIEKFSRRSLKYANLMGLDRLCETAGKVRDFFVMQPTIHIPKETCIVGCIANAELLICEIIWPSAIIEEDVSYQDISKFSVKETIMKRWIPSQERIIE